VNRLEVPFPTIVEVSTLKVVNILDRQSGPPGDEYECELEPVWFAADLVEKAQMGRFHIRAYENRLVRARRRDVKVRQANP